MRYATTTACYVLDLNVWVDLAQRIDLRRVDRPAELGRALSALLDTSPATRAEEGLHAAARLVEQACRGRGDGARLFASQEMITTLRHVLSRVISDPMPPALAARYCAVVAMVCEVSGGRWNVDPRSVNDPARGIFPELVGDAYGQIDHEDLGVIATALAVRRDTGGPGVVLVTFDRGLQGVGASIAGRDVLVLSPQKLHRVTSALARRA
ncbi:hypothetical protein [Bailinhaonella thermotolerans]|uniref:Uncharacterized protein n=1 Tax=Bailinhaonella thermotolerans TaxID=1070861 RepID=A0A3A4A513_9ACTN|nr:hypothetical protein [Bailinhaonella thermotolerans]RJL23906.1 hypothetical protein D5H75_31190 [Bailinhaonella thermotolerans]